MNRKPRSINTGDDIKARLRDWPSWVSEESATTIVHLAREAADHIEALEANQCPGDCTTYRTSLLTRAKTLETENQKLAYAALKAEAEVERLRDWIQDIRSPRNLGADR